MLETNVFYRKPLKETDKHGNKREVPHRKLTSRTMLMSESIRFYKLFAFNHLIVNDMQNICLPIHLKPEAVELSLDFLHGEHLYKVVFWGGHCRKMTENEVK